MTNLSLPWLTTAISVTGPANSRVERLLRGLWWLAVGVLALLLLLLALLVAFGNPYKPGSPLGYNLGLVGGLMMLSLLLYSLRKRVHRLEVLGKMASWFRYHMVVGILGPLLVLFHSTFRTHSMNGSVALYAMVLVACSGVVGRFLYRHIHAGLYGRQLSLNLARAELQASMRNLDSVYALAPGVESRLQGFQQLAFAPLDGLAARAWRFLMLRRRSRRLARELRREASVALRRLGREKRLSAKAMRLNYRLAAAQLDWFLDAVVKTAQLAGWERCFSLWHVVHVPFIYLLLVSGIVHVVAVHMY